MKRLLIAVLGIFLVVSCRELPENVRQQDAYPNIYPDYIGVTIPVGIAPLNFDVLSPDCEGVYIEISASDGEKIVTSGRRVDIDIDEWHSLLSSSIGDTLMVSVCSKSKGVWERWRSFPIYVSVDSLPDYGLTYRRISPVYDVYSDDMGIYLRELSSFKEKTLVDCRLSNMCVNCHTQNRTSTNDVMFHIRGEVGGTFIRHDGECELVDTRLDSLMSACVYSYWHPSGRYIAFSVNATRQAFHVGGLKRIEVFDKGSDIVIYDVEKREIIKQPTLAVDTLCETYPVFSPDGKWLYYSVSKRPEDDECEKFKYDINRIKFDMSEGSVVDTSEVVVDASSNGKNAIFPRISYDGRFLMYTISDYGSFSVWHKESDLMMVNLQSGETDSLRVVNSDDADSFHNWSSNSRWFVFCSRRDDGLYTRLYIGHVGEDGRCDKPFMLPQKEPAKYYGELMQSYNVPDFCHEEYDMNHRYLKALLDKGAAKVTLRDR
ncbi:MAG: PD40 domain-containing protein [Marinilabiliaceae bacterium]|nr:PD40 domain-containing protein [Marinilabiliaceae bacterium]